MSLSKSSVDFFKKEARKHHTSYQAMIRRLLVLYLFIEVFKFNIGTGLALLASWREEKRSVLTQSRKRMLRELQRFHDEQYT
jgi:hypothetical protein